MSETYAGTLNSLYDRTIQAIRIWDPVTPIILESTYWASPRTLRFLRTYNDPSIVYSFHMYAPPALHHPLAQQRPVCLSGAGPKLARFGPDGGIKYWDKEALRGVPDRGQALADNKNIPNRNFSWERLA